ncbi:hypothetical protein M446_2814 [Methylobacterium sp. 4-46]|uniref:hypothetical protein n=1 Tax=unclassified Methylobacterium TaxID=2615210 RepID=UPI000165C8FB|nr:MULTISPECIES: hypothetical protein [Methylobacterium]ACA17244.1 hypothetical protein M446_2814 [Methylobacterium sp. 4-46]WFT82930.1 hypothetical protein QA634_14265 [Methylobacterium nodulans]
MIVLVAAAMVGAIVTASVVQPYGAVYAVLAAPFGGSTAALFAAVMLVHRNSEDWQRDIDLDTQTDEMVAMLRDVAAPGREVASATEEVQTVSDGTHRDRSVA